MTEYPVINSNDKNAAGCRYSIHTIELRKRLNYEEFRLLGDLLSHHCQESGQRQYHPKSMSLDGPYYEKIFEVKKTINISTIRLCVMKSERSSYFFMRILINLRIFLGIKIHPYICILPGECLRNVFRELENKFSILNFPQDILSECYLKRVDFCTNIDLGS